MKTDTIFYSLFQEFPTFFFELIDRQLKTLQKFTTQVANRKEFGGNIQYNHNHNHNHNSLLH